MASGPITSWEIDGETVETVSDFILGGSKITADSDRSHDIKRRLLLGRKVMTNLDSILKSRDITLPTKVCLVKAMVFPVVIVWMWVLDCEEGWAPKNWCFWTVVLEKTLESPLDCNQSILQGINPAYPLKGPMLRLKLQYFGHLRQRADPFGKTLMLGKIEGRRRRGWQRTSWLDGITESMDMSLSKLRVFEEQGSLPCCSPWGCKESDTTEQLNWVCQFFCHKLYSIVRISVNSVQLLSRVRLFATPWTAARQAPLTFTVSWILQIHFCWVSDAIQPSHPLSSPSPPPSVYWEACLVP